LWIYESIGKHICMSARVCVHVRVHVYFCAYAHTSTHLCIYMRAAPERTHTPALTRSLSLTHTHAHSLTHSPIHTHTRVHCTGNTLITLSRTEGLSLYHFPTLALRTRLAPRVCVCMCVRIYTNSVYIHYTCLAPVAYVYRYSIDHIHNINIYTCMNTNIHKYTHTFILGNPFCKGGLQNAGVWVWSAFSKLVFGSSGTNVPKTGYNNPLDGPNPEFGNPLAGELLTINIQTYMHTFLTNDIHTYMHTYIHICIHTYAYIHTYIHICIHTYILTCIHPTNTQTQMLIIHKHTFRRKKNLFGIPQQGNQNIFFVLHHYYHHTTIHLLDFNPGKHAEISSFCFLCGNYKKNYRRCTYSWEYA